MATTNKNCIEFLSKDVIGTDYTFKHEILWSNAISFLLLHVCASYGIYLFLAGFVNYKSILWFGVLWFLMNQGVTAGAHRYYAHRCYKAKPLLQVFLIICHTITGQNSLYIWVRDHRLHHRYSDTDADPHNSNRGFFFSHMGWLMTKKHPYVKQMGRKIDMSDLLADPLVMMQYRYYYAFFFVWGVLVPIGIPVYFFGMSLSNSIFCFGFFRYVLSLHLTWTVNSIAHLYGTRPYDKNLQPVESWFVSFISMGEGWHNYHHAFPWDYKAAELGMHTNITAIFIRCCERIGLAYDLKSASPEIVKKRIARTGDGSHYIFGNDEDRASVTAFGPVYPLNPTYTSSKKNVAPTASS